MEHAGGDFPCRFCGTTHDSSVVHQNVSRLQKAQMAVEKMQTLVDAMTMKSHFREKVKSSFDEIRAAMGIPNIPLYENYLFPFEEHTILDGTAIEQETTEMNLSKRLGQEDIRRERNSRPTADELEQGKKLVEYFIDLIIENVALTADHRDTFEKAMEELKNFGLQ